jgi:hypothetical protein
MDQYRGMQCLALALTDHMFGGKFPKFLVDSRMQYFWKIEFQKTFG